MTTTAAPAATALPIADALWNVLVSLNAAEGTDLPWQRTGSAYQHTSDALTATLAAAYGPDLAVRIREAASVAWQAPSTIVEYVLREARAEAEDAHAAATADYARFGDDLAWETLNATAATIDALDALDLAATLDAEARAAESAALWTAVDTSTDDDAPGYLDLIDAAL